MDQNTFQAKTKITTPDAPFSAAPSTPARSQKSKALIATSVICALLAVAGIAFGVYGLLAANQKSEQISDLESQLSELSVSAATPIEAAVSVDSDAPSLYSVISDTSDTHYTLAASISFLSSDFTNDQRRYILGAQSSNGELSCSVYESTEDFSIGSKIRDCDISAHRGKVVDIINGAMGNGGEYPVFVLNDFGEVEYINGDDQNTPIVKTLELPEKVVRIWGDKKVGGQPIAANGELSPVGGGYYTLAQYENGEVIDLYGYYKES